MSRLRKHEIEYGRANDSSVIEDSHGKLSISIPIKFKHRSGRCLITLPDEHEQAQRPWDTDVTPIQLALARGHHWLQMLMTSEVKSMREIAKQEGVDNSYISRMINLTTLAPDIVDAILEDKLPSRLTLFELAAQPPYLWTGQRTQYISHESIYKMEPTM